LREARSTVVRVHVNDGIAVFQHQGGVEHRVDLKAVGHGGNGGRGRMPAGIVGGRRGAGRKGQQREQQASSSSGAGHAGKVWGTEGTDRRARCGGAKTAGSFFAAWKSGNWAKAACTWRPWPSGAMSSAG